jgi:hypothetical protein
VCKCFALTPMRSTTPTPSTTHDVIGGIDVYADAIDAIDGDDSPPRIDGGGAIDAIDGDDVAAQWRADHTHWI